jgi:predicted  nucleic acid-binding Zn-ribbon protein
MMRLGRLQLALVLTLGVALIASVGMILRLSWRLAALERLRATDRQSLRELQQALRLRELQKTPAEAESPAPPSNYQAALAKRDATIERLNRELSEAQANIMGLQAQLLNSSEENEKALASADERHQKEQADLQSQLDALKQELESAQAESQASRQRLAALETDNAKLKSDNNAASARAAEFARLVAQLQDLDSRRESYLTSIMRRYREITSQFRAMSGMLGSSRDSNSASPFSDAALTRIQSAVSSADDDLRQLTELNAQARQLEKKLMKK